jgi:hypothetical protein
MVTENGEIKLLREALNTVEVARATMQNGVSDYCKSVDLPLEASMPVVRYLSLASLGVTRGSMFTRPFRATVVLLRPLVNQQLLSPSGA